MRRISSKISVWSFMMGVILLGWPSEEIWPHSQFTEETCLPGAPMTASFYEDNPTFTAPLAPLGEWATTTPETEGLSRALFEKAGQVLNAQPGALSFLVARRGHLIWEQYFNGSRAEHSNNIHSVSKSLLSALVGIALEKRYLKSIDQSLGDVLGDDFNLQEKSEIKIRHLLEMTSGIQWTEDETEYEIEDNKNWVQAILDLPLAHSPGSRFNYSTGDTHLLSAVLTKVTRQSTCEFSKKYLTNPMGIYISRWGRDPQGYSSGGCNLYMTPRSLTKLGQLFLNNGVWNEQQLLPPQWINDSWSSRQVVDEDFQYGYLWWLSHSNNTRVYMMWGYGGQFVIVLPEKDVVATITADTKEEHPELNGLSFVRNYLVPAIETLQ